MHIQDPVGVGVFPQRGDLKKFLTSKPAIAAGLRIQHAFERRNGKEACEQLITDYTDRGGDRGVTLKYIWRACGFEGDPMVGPVSSGGAQSVNVKKETDVAGAHTDVAGVPSLAIANPIVIREPLENLYEVTVRYLLAHEFLEILTPTYFKNVNHRSVKGLGSKNELFTVLKREGLLKPSRSKVRSTKAEDPHYPNIRTGALLDTIVPLETRQQIHHKGVVLRETYDVSAFREWVYHPHGRKSNAVALADAMKKARLQKRGGPGKPPQVKPGDPLPITDELSNRGEALLYQENLYERLLRMCASPLGASQEPAAKRPRRDDAHASAASSSSARWSQSVTYKSKSFGGRLFATAVSAQNLSQTSQKVLLSHTVDLDIVNTMPVLVDQLVRKLKLTDAWVFQEELQTLNDLATRRDDIISQELRMPQPLGKKKLLLAVMQGQRLPDAFRSHPYLRRVRSLSRFLRWLACSSLPEVYEDRVAQGKNWPESSCFAVWWQIAEGHVVQSLLTWVLSQGDPDHVSLHFDGIRLNRSLCERNDATVQEFCRSAEKAVEDLSGFRIQLQEKQHNSLIEAVRSASCTHTETVGELPPSIQSEGNCIPLALYHLRARLPSTAEQVWTETFLGTELANRLGGRTYRECFAVANVAYQPMFTLEMVPAGMFLLHCDWNGRPHCVAIEVDADAVEATIFEGDQMRRLPCERLRGMLDSCTDSKCLIAFQVTGEKSVLRPNVIHSDVLDLLVDMTAGAGVGGDPVLGGSENTSRSSSSLHPGGYTDVRHEMLDILRTEVESYMDQLCLSEVKQTRSRGKYHGGAWPCRLCPWRVFDSKGNLVNHLSTDHTHASYYSACGRKLLNVIYALYDADALAGRDSRDLIQTACRMMRATVFPPPSAHRKSLDRFIVLLYTGKGPLYTSLTSVTSRNDVLRVGHVYLDRDFANLLLREALLSHGRVRPLAHRLAHRLGERGALLSSLLPCNTHQWLALLEVVFMNPYVRDLLQVRLRQSLQQGDYRHISIDGTFRVMLRIRGQAPFNASATQRNAAVIPDHMAHRRVLTVLGVASTPLATFIIKNEHSDVIAEAFDKEWSDEERGAVLSVASDNPSGSLFAALSRVMPRLRWLTLDPVHLAISWEDRHGRRRTAGSRDLRRLMVKFWRFDPTKAAEEWGPPYTGAAPGITETHTAAESFYLAQVLTRSMHIDYARRVLQSVNPETPWGSAADFVQAIAALVSVHAKELKPAGRGRRKRCLTRVLAHACRPAGLQWLMNNIRLMHSIPEDEHALLATGTTANEVFVSTRL